jgi:hypothetical protein
MKKQFWACYDYGMGGIWYAILAESKSQIEQKYSELVVFDSKPAWLESNTEVEANILLHCSFDIDDIESKNQLPNLLNKK